MAMGTPATSMELPTDAVTDEFVDPGDSLRVGAANGIHFLSSAENTKKLPWQRSISPREGSANESHGLPQFR
jgi:hypothetical protein